VAAAIAYLEEEVMPEQGVTQVVAWWGAILATIVFIWDVIKWKLAGPKLRLRVNCNMKTMNMPLYEGRTLIVADVVNCGDRSTTITHLGFRYYRNLWDRVVGALFRRILKQDRTEIVILDPNPSLSLPHELQPGKMWDGLADQEELLEGIGTNRYILCDIYHTHRKRPLTRRVRLKSKIAADAS
jgi:hypothetical protein